LENYQGPWKEPGLGLEIWVLNPRVRKAFPKLGFPKGNWVLLTLFFGSRANSLLPGTKIREKGPLETGVYSLFLPFLFLKEFF